MSEQKRLIRSTRERKIGGVAGGLGRYLQIDPNFVRLGFVVLALFNGLGILIYFIAWLLIPADTQSELTGEAAIRANIQDMRAQARRLTGGVRGGQGTALIGILLVGAGAVFLLREFVPGIPPGLIWPMLMIAAGVYILFIRR
jgi:phage shock protein C